MNKILTLRSIFESELAQDQEVQSQEIEVFDKSDFITKYPFKDYDVKLDNDGISVQNPDGYTFAVTEDSLNFYKHLFTNSIQHYNKYEKYLPIIDRLLEVGIDEHELEVKINRIKDMKKTFAVVEDNADLHSMLHRIFNTDEISPDQKKSLFNAYSSGNASGVMKDDLRILSRYLNDYLYYYKFLLGMMKLFDEED